MSWRKINLANGSVYRFTRSASTPMGSYEEGEIVTFEGSSYSRYDSATILALRTQSGEIKRFFLHDDDELPTDLLEEVK